LVCRGSEVQTITQALHIHQYPEAKLRPNDLVLLEEAVRETPNDARLWGYLGREYYFHGDMEAASRTYRTFLTHNSDTQERVQAMLYLARAEPDSAEMWLALARREGPAYREPLVDLAQLYHNRHDWKGCYEAALAALALAERPDSYICTSEAWGERPQDLAAIAAWNMGLADEAVEHARQAVIYAPDDLRLQANLRYMRQDMAAASRTYRTFLTHNSDTQERVQAMLYLARIEPDSAEIWLALARREGPAYREPLVDLAQLYHNRKDWKRCYETALAALALKERPDSYICTSEAWGERPHDLAAIAAWNMGLLDEAVEHARQAVIYAPDDLRLQANLRYMRQDIPQKAA
jgi:tetratricopeptide (TPR) repeat protein